MSCFLSIGIGFGISSSLTFLLLISVGLSRESLLITETLVAVIFAALFLYRWKSQTKLFLVDQCFLQSTVPSGLRRAISISFLIVLSWSVMIFVASSWRNPHGGFDAFAIWNLRARFLFRAGTHWVDAFSQHLDWSHVDYPLLIPTNVARGWIIAGNETVVIPIAIAFIFTFGTVGLIVSCLSTLRGTNQGLIAGSVFLGASTVVLLGASQLADIPLGYLLLSSLVFLALRNSVINCRPRMLFLAGVSAGFSAWTKNEGVLFLGSVIISLFILGVVSKQQRSYVTQIGYFCLGAVPILLMIIFFKIQFAASNDLLSGQSLPTMINRLFDLSRHVTVLTVFQREIRNFSYWPFSLPVVLLFYLLVFGLTTEVQLQREILLLVMILAVMLSGYYLIYILTPHDVIWHLQYSLNRLLAQLWGSAVFAYFLGARTVEKVLSTRDIQISIQPLEGTVTRQPKNLAAS